MQRVLPWTLLIAGLLIGYIVGLESRPPQPPTVPGGQTGTPEPRKSLPFHLATCSNPPDCLGTVEFPREIESPSLTPTPGSTRTASPVPGGSPSPKPTVRPANPFNLISNMSANRAGGRFVPGSWPLKSTNGTWVEVMSLPEDPTDNYSPQRLQTLYEKITTAGTQYALVTCIPGPKADPDMTPSCSAPVP